MKYSNIIDTFTWSHSRITAFEMCPYSFLLKYIFKVKTEEKFFAQYGTFIHKILEKYYKGELEQFQLVNYYLSHFYSNVTAKAPSAKVFADYFKTGLNYFKDFTPDNYQTLGVEKEIHFSIEDKNFTGYIDRLSLNGDNIYITDNKSRNLKQRSGRAKPTKTDIELDKYLRQLYLYSKAVAEEYDRFPQKLIFNCFRNGNLIEEDFSREDFEKAQKWALETIDKISAEEEWNPDAEWFKCKHICDCSSECEYYQLLREANI